MTMNYSRVVSIESRSVMISAFVVGVLVCILIQTNWPWRNHFYAWLTFTKTEIDTGHALCLALSYAGVGQDMAGWFGPVYHTPCRWHTCSDLHISHTKTSSKQCRPTGPCIEVHYLMLTIVTAAVSGILFYRRALLYVLIKAPIKVW